MGRAAQPALGPGADLCRGDGARRDLLPAGCGGERHPRARRAAAARPAGRVDQEGLDDAVLLRQLLRFRRGGDARDLRPRHRAVGRARPGRRVAGVPATGRRLSDLGARLQHVRERRPLPGLGPRTGRPGRAGQPARGRRLSGPEGLAVGQVRTADRGQRIYRAGRLDRDGAAGQLPVPGRPGRRPGHARAGPRRLGGPDRAACRGSQPVGSEHGDPDRPRRRAARRAVDGGHLPAGQRRGPGPAGPRDPRAAGGQRAADHPLPVPRDAPAPGRARGPDRRGLDRRAVRGPARSSRSAASGRMLW